LRKELDNLIQGRRANINNGGAIKSYQEENCRKIKKEPGREEGNSKNIVLVL
jgi:hypothetical protein